jgi:hypothetical protein
MKRHSIWERLALLIVFGCVGCTVGAPDATTASQESSLGLDLEALRASVGAEGEENDGEWKWTVPQNDLDVSVDGFRIVPPMGLGSWAAFTPAPEGAAVMGDLVLLEDEVGPVQRRLLAEGLTITALHKHFLRENPRVAYMHFGGRGPEAELGTSIRSVFEGVAELRGGDPGADPAPTVENTLDVGALEAILGHSGTLGGGVFKVTIGRPDVTLQARGATVSTFGGFNTWAAFQGTPERAAVAGDFAMLAHEVPGVLQALAEHDIEVVVLHNHMIHEEPRIFFLHYWGVGPAEALARGLRAALDQTG